MREMIRVIICTELAIAHLDGSFTMITEESIDAFISLYINNII
jgi:hypothetical protein